MEQARVDFETPRVVGEKVPMKTKLTVGDFVDKVARFEFSELKRITRFAENAEIPNQREIRDYLITLLDARVKHVNGEKHSLGRSFRTVRVPSRWYVLLAQVGNAKDFERRFEFTPELEVPADYQPMTLEKIEDISWTMESFLQEGYTSQPGLPVDPDGSLQFMAKTTVGNIVRGMDNDNPVYAFLAAVLENEVAAESYDNLDLVFRIQYSTFDTYSAAFQSYFVNSTNELGGISNETQQTSRPPDTQSN